MRDAGCGVRVTGNELRVEGCGVRVLSFGFDPHSAFKPQIITGILPREIT